MQSGSGKSSANDSNIVSKSQRVLQFASIISGNSIKSIIRLGNIAFLNVISIIQLLIILRLYPKSELDNYTSLNILVTLASGFVFALVNPSLKFFHFSSGKYLLNSFYKITGIFYVILTLLICEIAFKFKLEFNKLLLLIVLLNYVIGVNRFLLYYFQKEHKDFYLYLYNTSILLFLLVFYFVRISDLFNYLLAFTVINLIVAGINNRYFYRSPSSSVINPEKRLSGILIYFIKKQFIPSAIFLIALQVDRYYYMIKYGTGGITQFSFLISVSYVIVIAGSILGSVFYTNALKNTLAKSVNVYKRMLYSIPLIYFVINIVFLFFSDLFIDAGKSELMFFKSYSLSNSFLALNSIFAYIFYVNTKKISFYLYLTAVPVFFKVLILAIWFKSPMDEVLIYSNFVYSVSTLFISYLFLKFSNLRLPISKFLNPIIFSILFLAVSYFAISAIILSKR